MAHCRPILGLVLSQEGKRALREIQKVVEKGKQIQVALTAGTLVVSVFNGKALATVFNVSTNDWTLLAKGVRGLTYFQQKQIEIIVADQIIKGAGGTNEQIFWKEFSKNCIFK